MTHTKTTTTKTTNTTTIPTKTRLAIPKYPPGP
jgi:hypothetical protein